MKPSGKTSGWSRRLFGKGLPARQPILPVPRRRSPARPRRTGAGTHSNSCLGRDPVGFDLPAARPQPGSSTPSMTSARTFRGTGWRRCCRGTSRTRSRDTSALRRRPLDAAGRGRGRRRRCSCAARSRSLAVEALRSPRPRGTRRRTGGTARARTGTTGWAAKNVEQLRPRCRSSAGDPTRRRRAGRSRRRRTARRGDPPGTRRSRRGRVRPRPAGSAGIDEDRPDPVRRIAGRDPRQRDLGRAALWAVVVERDRRHSALGAGEIIAARLPLQLRDRRSGSPGRRRSSAERDT